MGMIQTFKEFIDYYEKTGRIPNDFSYRKNKLNETQLKSKYEKYLKKLNKEQEKREENKYTIDERWEELKAQLDLEHCQLIKKLQSEDRFEALKELKFNASWLIKTIDPAHIFPRSGYPELKYDVDNVVPLNRYSHSCIDTMRDPINGNMIDKETQQLFWKYIVGDITYNKLEKRTKN